jgi:hypothetical protein
MTVLVYGNGQRVDQVTERQLDFRFNFQSHNICPETFPLPWGLNPMVPKGKENGSVPGFGTFF